MKTPSDQHKPEQWERIDDPMVGALARVFLQYTVNALLLSALVFGVLVLFLYPGDLARLLSQSLFLVLALAARQRMLQGRLAQAVTVLTFGSWIVVTGISALHSGVGAPAIITYPLMVMTAAWLISRRAALILAGMSVAAILGLALLGIWNLLPAVPPTPPLLFAGSQVFVLVLSTLLMISVVGVYQTRLQQVGRVTGELERRSQELEASAATLKATLDAVPDLMFELDLDGRYHDCHFHHLDLLAASPQDLIGKRVCDVLAPEAAATVMACLQEANVGSRSTLRQYALVLAQGVRWFEISVARKLQAAQEGPRFIAIVRDVTRRENGERELAKSLSLLDATLAATQDAILVVDLKRNWVLHNPQFARLWQISEEDLRSPDTGAALRRVLDQLEDAPGFMSAVNALYATPESSSFDIVRLRNGKVLERHSTPQRVDGRVAGRVWSFHDISAVKTFEEELRIAAKAFQSHSAIAIMDADYRVLRVNQAFSKITGYSADEAMGQHSSFMRSGRLPASYFTEVIALELELRGEWRGEMWMRRKNGEEYPAQVTLSLIRDDDGRKSHCVSSFIDATTEQLRQRQRLLDELAQRDALVREVHHRIKNNLHGVIGILHKYSRKHPQTAAALQQAIGEVHAVSVIHGLQGRAVTSAVQLCELTRAIAREIEHLWQTPVSLSMDPLWLDCVVAQDEAVPVALVLNELILNAVKHRGPEQGEVSISLETGPLPNVLHIRICNSGRFAHPGDAPAARRSGLSLISALLPRVGARLMREQHPGQVVSVLALEAPVISLAVSESVW